MESFEQKPEEEYQNEDASLIKANNPRRNQRTVIITALCIFFAVLLGMFVFAYMQQDDSKTPLNQEDEQMDGEVEYASITRIQGKHFYEDGVHTIVGEISMPTPCDLLEVDATVAESMPEQISLNFSVINNADFCAQQITAQRYKVSASASEDATFRATFEGREVELNLIPAEEGESPEDFEVFIKG